MPAVCVCTRGRQSSSNKQECLQTVLHEDACSEENDCPEGANCTEASVCECDVGYDEVDLYTCAGMSIIFLGKCS